MIMKYFIFFPQCFQTIKLSACLSLTNTWLGSSRYFFFFHQSHSCLSLRTWSPPLPELESSKRSDNLNSADNSKGLHIYDFLSYRDEMYVIKSWKGSQYTVLCSGWPSVTKESSFWVTRRKEQNTGPLYSNVTQGISLLWSWSSVVTGLRGIYPSLNIARRVIRLCGVLYIL